MLTVVQTSMPWSSSSADVVVALVAHRTGCVRVRQLVDDRDARAALDQPVDVELGLGPAARAVAQQRRALEPARALLGGDAPVRLEVADHEVGALLGGQTSVAEHLVGLADAGGRAEVEAQESAQAAARRPRPECRPRAQADRASLDALQTLGRVLSGVFARALVPSRHGLLRRGAHRRSLRSLRRVPGRNRAAVTTSQIVGLIVAIGLFLYFVVALLRPERF